MGKAGLVLHLPEYRRFRHCGTNPREHIQHQDGGQRTATGSHGASLCMGCHCYWGGAPRRAVRAPVYGGMAVARPGAWSSVAAFVLAAGAAPALGE